MQIAANIAWLLTLVVMTLGSNPAWGQTAAKPTPVAVVPPNAKSIVFEIRTLSFEGEDYPQYLEEELGWDRFSLVPPTKAESLGDLELPNRSEQNTAGCTQQTIAISACMHCELSDQEMKNIARRSSGAKTRAPTLTVFDGQQATISDAAKRPFVTPTIDPNTKQFVPAIKLFDDGSRFQILGKIENGKIQTRGIFEHAQITKVSEIELPPIDGVTQGTRYQLPETRVERVEFSALIGDGNTLMIIPTTVSETVRRTESKFLKKPKLETVKRRIAYLITPRIIQSTAVKPVAMVR